MNDEGGWCNMKHKLYQQVALARDISDKKLQRGDVATIVECHPAKKGESGYTIEVFNAVGDTIVVTTLPESSLQELTAGEILHIRPLAKAG